MVNFGFACAVFVKAILLDVSMPRSDFSFSSRFCFRYVYSSTAKKNHRSTAWCKGINIFHTFIILSKMEVQIENWFDMLCSFLLYCSLLILCIQIICDLILPWIRFCVREKKMYIYFWKKWRRKRHLTWDYTFMWISC